MLYAATMYQITMYVCMYPMDGGAWWAVVHRVTNGQTPMSDFTFTFPFMHWRRKWQPTPVLLPGESQEWGSLVGCRLWGCTELDTTEVTLQQQQQQEIKRKCFLHTGNKMPSVLLS